MTSPDICILVPDPAHPEYAPMWPQQQAILAAALALGGMRADATPWTAAAELARYDLVLPLLAWGYHDAPASWHAALDAWQADGVRLANRAALHWNADKAYLVDLAERGAPVVPSRLAAHASAADLAAARERFGDVEIIAKPTVSAGAHGVARIAPGAPLPDAMHDQRVLFQPMLRDISDEGEYSLFWFGGQFSHAVLKVPKAGDFRVQSQHGGRERPVEPPHAAFAAAQAVLALIEDPLLYARVDLVADGTGAYVLMELELIEPQLFLEHASDQGLGFARAIRTAAESGQH